MFSGLGFRTTIGVIKLREIVGVWTLNLKHLTIYYMGFIKGDTRSLDHGSDGSQILGLSLLSL